MLRRCLRPLRAQKACFSGAIITPEAPALIKPASKSGGEPRGSVASFLRDRIRTSGPVTVAEYMKLCLTAPSSGYYTGRKSNRVLGDRGDFITSPELGQIFGEMLGVWAINEIYTMGIAPRQSWQLLELGPGSGLLMSDMLRVLKQFGYTESLSVHLVELSRPLAEKQQRTLCNKDAPVEAGTGESSWYQRSVTRWGVPVYWYAGVEDVPRKFNVVVAHEFLDALPIHYFQRHPDSGKWAEVCVDFDDAPPQGFKFVLSARETSSLRSFLPPTIRDNPAKSHWETSPQSHVVLKHVADLMVERGGIGLIVDYGHSGEKEESTLRGFKRHQVVSPLETPGEVDLTADVNFAAIKALVESVLLVYGPVTQAAFLSSLGVAKRQEMLLAKAKSDKDLGYLEKCYSLMMSLEEMGERFKVLALYPKTASEIMDLRKPPVPPGFT